MKIKLIVSGIIGLIVLFFITVCFFNQYQKNTLTKNINQIDDNDINLGTANDSKNIIVYFDYNCDFCKKFFDKVYPKIEKEYIIPSKINLIIRLICHPTDKMATEAYQSLICINKFGGYTKAHQLLMHNSKIIYSNHFTNLIDDIIASNSSIAECILTSENNAILNNIHQFQELNTNKTPTFVIGQKIATGFINFEDMTEIINTQYFN